MSAHLMKKNAFIYTSIQQNTLLVTAHKGMMKNRSLLHPQPSRIK